MIGRRGFLATFVAPYLARFLPTAELDEPFYWKSYPPEPMANGAQVLAAWETYVKSTPADNIFDMHSLLERVEIDIFD